MTKVSLSDAPTSELFNNRAQDVMKRLDPKRTPPSREVSVRHSPSPDDDDDDDDKGEQEEESKKQKEPKA
jgi:hypothetical protein